MNNQWFSKVAVWLVIALVLFTVFKQFERTGAAGGAIGYSDFLEEVRAKRIKSVQLQDVGIGDESCVTAVAGQLAIRARRVGGSSGRLARSRCDQDTSIGRGHSGGQIVIDHQAIGLRHVEAEARRRDIRSGRAVEQ